MRGKWRYVFLIPAKSEKNQQLNCPTDYTHMYMCLQSASNVTAEKFGKFLRALSIFFFFFCPEAKHGRQHSIRIVECHRKIVIISKHIISSPRLEPSKMFAFVTLVPVIYCPKQSCSLRCTIVLIFQPTENIFNGNQTQDSFFSRF